MSDAEARLEEIKTRIGNSNDNNLKVSCSGYLFSTEQMLDDAKNCQISSVTKDFQMHLQNHLIHLESILEKHEKPTGKLYLSVYR